MRYILALDQGTTSSRAVAFDETGRMVGSHGIEFPQHYPHPGWVEHDPKDILDSQIRSLKLTVELCGIDPGDIAAVGITNQRETTLLWDRRTGEPVCNAIVWQCRRTADRIETLRSDGMRAKIMERTGLIPDAYYSGSKLEWILDHVEGVRERAERGELLFGTVDSWLIWNLTKGAVHVTDYTNASRTMLYDIHKMQWDEEILEYFRIPRCMLPQVRPSSCIYGYTSSDVMGGRIPIAGAAGDQQAALFGQCCFEPGQMKNTYGTGGFLLMNTGDQAVRSENGLITTIAAGVGKVQYALEGSVFVSGAAVQWLRDEMRMVRSSAQTEEYCTACQDTGGVYIVPAFAGLGAPYWDQYARGTVVGLTRGTSKEQFIRATVESMAYQAYDVIESMEKDSGLQVTELKVDGGASANNFLMQFQADLLQADIVRPQCIETTALGAAYLAGLAVGYWQSLEEIRTNWKAERRFTGQMPEEQRRTAIRGWKRAVRAAVAWAEEF